MNTETIRTSTISEIVEQHPGAIQVLEKLHVDYCCNAKLPFTEACKRADVNEAVVIAALGSSPTRYTASAIRAQDWSLDLLTNFIVQNHHQYVKRAIPEIRNVLEKVCAKHGANHPELMEIQQQFKTLAKELESHMHDEEFVMFPAVQALVKESTNLMPFGDSERQTKRSLLPEVTTLEAEHELAGHCLSRMRTASRDYALPADACNAFTLLYQRLQEFESDLHVHIHLENNILFPKALTLQARQQSKPLYVN